MIRSIMACVLLGSFTCMTAADDSVNLNNLKKLAVSLSDAFMKGDHAFVIDHTYDNVVKVLGGRTKAISALEAGMKAMLDKGVNITSYNVSDPEMIVTSGNSQYTVVPTVIEMTFPQFKIRANSYLLGISDDSGKTWKFIDGSSMANPESRKLFLSNLPADFKLSPKQQPEIIRNKKSN